MGLLDFLRRRRPTPPERAAVTFDDKEITCRRPPNLVDVMKWADLCVVVIQTTDQGPFVDDIFWVLVGKTSCCIVPSESKGVDQLVARLRQLPSFDYGPAVRAMSSAENREFVCWRRTETN
jgi:hypothetical protein